MPMTPKSVRSAWEHVWQSEHVFDDQTMKPAPPNLESAALLALLRAPGARWQQIAADVEEAGSALVVLEQQSVRAQASIFDESAGAPDLTTHLADLDAWTRDGFSLLTVLDAEYPENLRTAYDRPPLVFVAGELRAEDSRSIAVVGTRRPTDDGTAISRRISGHLVTHGYTVASGLAAGIDTAAHVAALEADGRTVAVIGTGLRRSYPKENAGLQARIAQEGAVISQFWPDAPPTKRSFPMRNGVMSGFALATVVVEAGQNSGSRMQARLALQHNRPVFLLRSLLVNAWATEMQRRPGVYVVDEPSQITETIQRLTSPALLTA
jgi:DNA processing protein